MNKMKKYKQANNIAVVRTDKLGDMILTLPLCAAIKKHKPNCKLTIIASKYSKELVENLSIIDSTLYIEDYPAGINSIFNENKFDAVFFPRPKGEEAWAAFKNKISLRIGSAYRIYSVLFNFKIRDHRKESKYLEAEYNVRMLNAITGENFAPEPVKPYVSDSDIISVDLKLKAIGISPEDKYIVLHPGSGGSARDWGAENFGLLAAKISETSKMKIIITGIKSEATLADTILRACPNAINLCGELTLGELKALLAKTYVFIANSTGTLHIAASMGANVIGFYPNTPYISAKRWAPLTDNKIIISPEDGSDDMNKISVESVFSKMSKLLKNN